MEILTTLFVLTLIFAAFTVFELFVLKLLGMDIVAHLKISRESKNTTKFYFEAFGAIAFVIGQPVLFMVLIVWAFGQVNPEILNSLQNFTSHFITGDGL